MQTVGILLVCFAIAGSLIFLIAREKARRTLNAQQSGDDAVGDWACGDAAVVPTFGDPVFHDRESAR